VGGNSAAAFVPVGGDLDELREAARGCRGCHLYENATQTVFSRGDANAEMVMVGEQPGDVEDQRGLPFVGPAGVLLRRAVGDLDLSPDRLYITNAVKHFKFRQAGRGQRRIHETPDPVEITACRPWLLAEFAQLTPKVVVVLGATAAQALLGPSFRVTRQRGVLLPWPESAYHADDFAKAGHHPPDGARVMATLHPSAILRADDRETAYAGFVADLKVAARALDGMG
jgi:uracil-DNA glycosylase family protein